MLLLHLYMHFWAENHPEEKTTRIPVIRSHVPEFTESITSSPPSTHKEPFRNHPVPGSLPQHKHPTPTASSSPPISAPQFPHEHPNSAPNIPPAATADGDLTPGPPPTHPGRADPHLHGDRADPGARPPHAARAARPPRPRGWQPHRRPLLHPLKPAVLPPPPRRPSLHRRLKR